MDKYIVLSKSNKFFKIDSSTSTRQLIEVSNLEFAETYTKEKLISLYI